MRTLYLIRHAKSSWDDFSISDFDRPLNRRGWTTAPEMAKLMRQNLSHVDLLVSSPAKRAITTAGYFAQVFDIKAEEIVQIKDIYEASLYDLMQVVLKLPDTAQTVFIFGHNPTFTDFVNYYSTPFLPNLPTCGIVQLESKAANWAAFSKENTRRVASFFPKEHL